MNIEFVGNQINFPIPKGQIRVRFFVLSNLTCGMISANTIDTEQVTIASVETTHVVPTEDPMQVVNFADKAAFLIQRTFCPEEQSKATTLFKH
ncbi:hypothetical protein IPO96_04570 [Candidatus Saccharibacteria bacterium]|nr:MAG: hypothetical protein IPO96_04570 [Candidatus Saccharibacteria bacterium]